jgi:heptosyltransferase-2
MRPRLAVFVPNWVGDAVMATPALRALRAHFGPTAHIVGIMKPVIAELLEGTPWLNSVWRYRRGSDDWSERPPALLWRLVRTRFDLTVHLTNDLPSVLLARLGGARAAAGYRRNRRGWLLTLGLDPPHDGRRFVPVSALDYYLRLAYALGCPPEPPVMELIASSRDEAAADAAWAAFGLGPLDPVVTLNSSGAFGSAKLWPEASCGELAVRIARDLDHAVVVLCGPGERERARRIAANAGHPRVFSLAGAAVSIGLTKAVVRRSRCLISTDSGPRHIGAAFGIPVVALFGPTEIAWSDTHYAREIRLQRAVPCGPCGQRECVEGHHDCMRGLSPSGVFEAVSAVLRGTAA